MLPASPMWTYNPLTEPMLSGSWVDPLFMGLINQKNGLSRDTPGALSIRGLQPKYRFQIRLIYF